MEIECQGCYYTLCSFVCLTEDLSEILQFLWKHGCLRRTYFCEKCGRKCAIGDKDLFFRCNRNLLETPITPQQVQSLPAQPNNQLGVGQTPSQIQSNENGQIVTHSIDQISHNQFMISNSSKTSEISQHGTSVPLSQSDSDKLLLFNHENKLQHLDLLSCKTVQSDSVNLTFVPNSMVNDSELNQSDRILTVIDSPGSRIIHGREQNNALISCRNSNVLIVPVLQSESSVSNPSDLNEKSSEPGKSEPPAKILKKIDKPVGGKVQKKRCNFKVSMKKGTFFEKSKLPIDTVCKFVVFWCCMKHPTQEFLRNELSLATRTVVDWSTACREICVHWAKSVSEKIGGDGVMVQVDEVKIQDSRETKPNDSGNRFSFWGMEKDREKGKIFIVPVPACDSWSLLTVINDWVLPGSIIISNCWKAYDCLKLQEFIEQTVVQSKTFVHPQNSAGQQNFEGKSDETGTSSSGDFCMPRFGTRRSHHLGDLAEFMFKRRFSNHLERMHAFFKQISLAYPLH